MNAFIRAVNCWRLNVSWIRSSPSSASSNEARWRQQRLDEGEDMIRAAMLEYSQVRSRKQTCQHASRSGAAAPEFLESRDRGGTWLFDAAVTRAFHKELA